MKSVDDGNLIPLGATVSARGVDYRVYAPGHRCVEVEFSDGRLTPFSLADEGNGYFHGVSNESHSGDLYRYRLDAGDSYPDPYSRYQPRGPHGPSMVVDPNEHTWQDSMWPGLESADQIIYELHIGTFTEAGTYQAAGDHLADLRAIGFTCIEIMPVNEFAGGFGWGYDGVNWFAPYHCYGTPIDLKAFVDRAHSLGLGVILDVVYNHFGHDGNYLQQFAAEYLTDEVANPWGSAPNYRCHAMRRLAIDNASYWVREFHIDGLRLDAIQSIHDPQAPTLLASLVSEARLAAASRKIVVAAEDYLQRTPLIRPAAAGGADMTYLWNDDFHHVCRVAMTGNHYGFFTNYRGSAQELLSSLKHGFLFQGQYDAWNKEARGLPARDVPLNRFIAFLQNHDAVANTLHGQRLQSIVSPGLHRAMTAVLLLGTQTPLVFMGQEFAATTPFAYFADYPDDAGSLWNGRRSDAAQSAQYQDPAALAKVLNPISRDTVRASTLNHAERKTNLMTIRLFSDLIALRKRFVGASTASDVDGAVLDDNAFVFRWFSKSGDDRLLLVNMGSQLELRALAEPLLAPLPNRHWRQLWSSESTIYGGMGAIQAHCEHGWQLSADSACLLHASVD